MTFSMLPFNAFATGTLPERLAGVTAAETAVEIAEQTGWTGSAILASSASYGMVDALTAGPLASVLKAPILLQEAGEELNEDTKAELEKLDVETVYVTSGTAVISEDVASEFPDATRHFGITAYDTNVEVLKAFEDVLEYENVFVANGETAIDALAGAPLAAEYKSGIVLANGTANEGTKYMSGKLSATSVTVQALVDAGVTEADVLAANLEAYQTAISEAEDEALDSTEKIQAMVTGVNEAEAEAETETQE